ncbi:FecR domain-containing protein [Chitinophaga pendula]|uniref:FecR family protein n=1 Tax=Chitinophaga TaxID=79328 RepID=UPI0018DF25F7|nr:MULTISPECIES: FecR family protein [Chitinophaga]UCJ05424.1 FecR domain-containing protein [Chitinophaga pendula]
MDSTTLSQLLGKYRQQRCTEAELQLLYRWLDAVDAHSQEQLAFTDEERQQVKAVMLARILQRPVPVRRSGGLLRKWLQAAAVLLLIGTAVYFLLGRTKTTVHGERWVTQQTGAGQTLRMILPDSSVVVLAPNTTIQYADAYGVRVRALRLERGKAFFDTRSDISHPFTVTAQGITTTVLGTSFTVENMAAERVCRVSVATGKVKVASKARAYGELLPGKRFTVQAQDDLVMEDEVSVAEDVAWTKGELVLRNANLGQLVQLLEREYAVKVTTKLDMKAGSYTLRVPANTSLEELLVILRRISYQPKLHFTHKAAVLTIY